VRAARLLLFCLLVTAPLRAQTASEAFGGNCATASSGARDLCLRLAEGARILTARTPVVLSGGNPVPGTASTLGMRIGSQPRLSIAARVTGSPVTLPGFQQAAANDELGFTATAIALDVGVGVFGGLTLASTVGGFGSVDLLASVAHLRMPADEGLFGDLTSWSGGVRLGLLRESFTAPGVSVSAMYREIDDFGYGDPALAEHDAWFRTEGLSGWSIRAAASKRLLGLGLTAGAGRDCYSGQAIGRIHDPVALSGILVLRDDDLESRRTTLFANAAFTLIILHAVAELGWQSGGREEAAIPTTGRLEQAGLYGSLAIRLSL